MCCTRSPRPTVGHFFPTDFPIDPDQGVDILSEILKSTLKEDIAGVKVAFGNNFSFPFCGVDYTQASVNIRGDIVLGMTVRRSRTPPTLKAHISLPRVSALLGLHRWDKEKSSVRMLELGDRIIFTYTDLPEAPQVIKKGSSATTTLYSSFQVSFHISGDIQVSYKKARLEIIICSIFAKSELALTTCAYVL